MAKKKETYLCTSCGFESGKWMGQCPQCKEWNTLEIAAAPAGAAALTSPLKSIKPSDSIKRLGEVPVNTNSRIVTGIGEFDRVMGGGIVKDSITILAAKPGAGKSTLLLQVAQDVAAQGLRVLYVSGEESESQIRRRAGRILEKIHEQIWVQSTASMNEVLGAIYSVNPQLVIADSIQTFALEDYPSRPGSPTQTIECTNCLLQAAKNPEAPRAVLMAGQLTKEDELAGVRALEHMVDTVLYMEAEQGEDLRVLAATKNRFGSTGEMGFFTMEEKGLVPIDNPSEYFMTRRDPGQEVSGSAITVVREGTRPMIAEIETLVSQSFTPYPSRISDCMKKDQLNTLISILEQRGGIPLYDKNVVVKTTGGLKLSQPSVNLALIASLVSSVTKKGIPSDTALIGDVGLTGELKRVPSLEIRLRELDRMEFRRVFLPYGSLRKESVAKFPNLEVFQLKTLSSVIQKIFGDLKRSF